MFTFFGLGYQDDHPVRKQSEPNMSGCEILQLKPAQKTKRLSPTSTVIIRSYALSSSSSSVTELSRVRAFNLQLKAAQVQLQSLFNPPTTHPTYITFNYWRLHQHFVELGIRDKCWDCGSESSYDTCKFVKSEAHSAFSLDNPAQINKSTLQLLSVKTGFDLNMMTSNLGHRLDTITNKWNRPYR